MSYMCGHIRRYQERIKCGYGRMVKFLFAKEKMRVRFPLSAHDKVMYYDKKFGIVDYDIIVRVSSSILPFYLPLIQKQK